MKYFTDLTMTLFDLIPESDTSENADSVLLRLSKKQVDQLRNCFLVLHDAYNISEDVNESCMNLLMSMIKPEGKELHGFIEAFVTSLKDVKANAK